LINRNAQRLLHLINQLMDFRKIETGKLDLKVQKGDITKFLENIFLSFDDLAKLRNINYTFNAQQIHDNTWFDQEKLENVVYNLLSNAFKYTPEGWGIVECTILVARIILFFTPMMPWTMASKTDD
jgi:signal transduction histidine kinase